VAWTEGASTYLLLMSHGLLAAAGAWFGAVALGNLRSGALSAQRRLWRLLSLAGLAAALYGVAGVFGVVRPAAVVATVRPVAWALFVLFLALGVRSVHEESACAAFEGGTLLSGSTARTLERGFVAVVVVEGVAAVVLDGVVAARLLGGTGGVLFAVYGGIFGGRVLSHPPFRGTTVDGVVSHLLAVLGVAGLYAATELAGLAGVGSPTVAGAGQLLVVVTGALLLAATPVLHRVAPGVG
jgi:hypothetical protein